MDVGLLYNEKKQKQMSLSGFKKEKILVKNLIYAVAILDFFFSPFGHLGDMERFMFLIIPHNIWSPP